MKNQNIQPLHQREYKPKREPIPRTWFLSHGYTKADTRYTNGHAIWLHPKTNDVYSAYGKLKLDLVPKEKHMKTIAIYLRINLGNGHILLARLKFLTFKGEIKKGEIIDHIDGNTLNNDIHNLRAVPRAINDRDGGFLRKLRNHGINVAMYSGIIIEGFERMAKWKATHTQYQYDHLTREELLHLLVGPKYKLVDPTILAAQEPDKYL